jgi:hypothetical protein
MSPYRSSRRERRSTLFLVVQDPGAALTAGRARTRRAARVAGCDGHRWVVADPLVLAGHDAVPQFGRHDPHRCHQGRPVAFECCESDVLRLIDFGHDVASTIVQVRARSDIEMDVGVVHLFHEGQVLADDDVLEREICGIDLVVLH